MSTGPNRKTSKELVDSFLEEFTSEKPTLNHGTHTSAMYLGDKLMGEVEQQDFSVLQTPDDMAAVTSILVSCLATAVGSSFTGFARAILEDMYPQLSAKLLEGEGNVTKEHVQFVKMLISQPLKQIRDADDKAVTRGEATKLPVNIEDLLSNVMAFGMAMHELGKHKANLKFETGMKQTMYKLLNNSLKNAGVAPGEGTLDSVLAKYIDRVVDASKDTYEKKNEQRTEARGNEPGLPESRE